MGKKLLKLFIPALFVLAALAGMLNPQPANAAGGVCRYYCLDPQLTCCITCYWVGSSCLCPRYCSIDPID